MKNIRFFCTRCELPRDIEINEVSINYIVGKCACCKSHIVINHKKLKKKVKVPVEAVAH